MKQLKKCLVLAAFTMLATGAFASVNENGIANTAEVPAASAPDKCEVTYTAKIDVGFFSGNINCTASAADCPTAVKSAMRCVEEKLKEIFG